MPAPSRSSLTVLPALAGHESGPSPEPPGRGGPGAGLTSEAAPQKWIRRPAETGNVQEESRGWSLCGWSRCSSFMSSLSLSM